MNKIKILINLLYASEIDLFSKVIPVRNRTLSTYFNDEKMLEQPFRKSVIKKLKDITV